MCDTVAGELLVSYLRDDLGAEALVEDIKNDRIELVEFVDDLETRLQSLELSIRGGIDFRFCRIRVPSGDEVFKTNYLQFFYKHKLLGALREMDDNTRDRVFSYSNHHFQVVPNSILSINSISSTESEIEFQFTQTHGIYKKMFGWKKELISTPGSRVLVLDTGIDSQSCFNVVEKRNFVHPQNAMDVRDDNGHGSAVAHVISEVYPAVELVVYKVADEHGRASEWDVLAGLAAVNGANVVNISLSFGLPDKICPYCGRESHSSRSAVFENMVDQVKKAQFSPILIAAAGNNGLAELAFPARFASVLAIESIDSGFNLSNFSNCSTIDHGGRKHENVFILPGGQRTKAGSVTEHVSISGKSTKYWGTSFSTAYASGIVAALWAQPVHKNKSGSDLVEHLRKSAIRNMAGYDPSIHGNGLLCFS